MTALALLLAVRRLDEPVLRPVLVGAGAFAAKGIFAPRGVKGDLERMTAVCRAYGSLGPPTLSGPGANRGAILAALDGAAVSAKTGDVCLFYYSGLGSTAKDGAASLVPYDAIPGSGGNDLPLAAVASWATKVKAAGARPVVVLDCCWPNEADVAGAQTKEWHPYDPTPRMLKRGKPVVRLGYDGPGVLLAAGGDGGHAYDWQTSETEWYGAFTDLVGQSVVTAGLRGQPLSPQGMYDVVARAAKDQADFNYMADFKPTLVGRRGRSRAGGAPARACARRRGG